MTERFCEFWELGCGVSVEHWGWRGGIIEIGGKFWFPRDHSSAINVRITVSTANTMTTIARTQSFRDNS